MVKWVSALHCSASTLETVTRAEDGRGVEKFWLVSRSRGLATITPIAATIATGAAIQRELRRFFQETQG